MFDLIYGHASFVPHTGYAAHSRDFFTRLNKFYPVRIRNYAHTPDLSHLTKEQQDMVAYMEWSEKPYKVGSPFNLNDYNSPLNIVLMEHNHFYYYDPYVGPKIGYCVWESTRMYPHFFKKLLEFDQLWVPSEWQRDCAIEQGYPQDRCFVVPEGVGPEYFPDKKAKVPEKFRFLVFGRWDYRKATLEMVQAFINEFKKDEPVELWLSVDNSFPVDGYRTTEERLEKNGLIDDRIKILHFPDKSEYIKLLQEGNVFLSCSRSEGWNLPLIEAIACGTPTISSNFGAQLDFAGEVSALVNIKEMKKPEHVFMADNVPGEWAEPDFEHLQVVMRDVYTNYNSWKKKAMKMAPVIKEKFAWEKAVDTAVDIIKNMEKKMPVKLNIGCGDKPMKGYVNIDKYVPADAKEITYADGTVDEVFSSHMLEHLGKHEVMPTLENWYRVLKENGKLIFDVPDLEGGMKYFLSSSEEERNRFALDMIFGSQHHEGEFHKTGFTHDRLRNIVTDAGFVIDVMKDTNSHDQPSIYVEATKRKQQFNDLVVIDCYPDMEEKNVLLREQIAKVKKLGYPVCLVSHYPIPAEFYETVDYVIYDKNNILSDGWNLNYWYKTPEVKIVSQYEKKYHAAACYSSLRNAVMANKDKFDYIHFLEFDVSVDLEPYIKRVNRERMKGKKLIGFYYKEEQMSQLDSGYEPTTGMITNVFSFDVNWMSSKLVEVKTWKDYVDAIHKVAETTKKRVDYIFENWMYHYFTPYLSDTFFFSTEDKKAILLNRNVFDQGKEEPETNYFLSETTDGKYVVFAIGKGFEYVIKESLTEEERGYRKASFKFLDDRVKCKDWNEEDGRDLPKTQNYKPDDLPDEISVTFKDGAKFEVHGDSKHEYEAVFIDKEIDMPIFTGRAKGNEWTAPYRRYYTDWLVKVKRDGEPLIEHHMDLKDKPVVVHLDSKSLGDTIAWFPYAEEFRKKHGCRMYVSSFHNHLFEKNYPDIKFIMPGKTINPYALYSVGTRDGDSNSNKNNWRTLSLQQTASEYLGLEHKEVRPKIVLGKTKGRPIADKYVTMSEHSTLRAKFWNNKNGWQEVVNFLNDSGYKVMVISSEKSELKNVVDRTNRNIMETINNIHHSEFYMGVSHGPSWLAWGLGKKVVMVSGFTGKYHEMQEDCTRIINETVCHDCLSDLNCHFDRGNFFWCPRNKKFECTTTIKSEDVICEIKKLL